MRGAVVNLKVFQAELDARIARYNLLGHPFYKAWSAGKLSREHLRAYAMEYFHQVAAFPTFLSALHSRLADGGLRRAVLRNLAEEEVEGRAHTDMWLDFAEGFGLSPERVRRSQPGPGVRNLIERFFRSACHDSPAQVLAALYAYESQVPGVSGEKARALLRHYGANAYTCGYFVLHSYADVIHSQVWRDELMRLVSRRWQLAGPALDAAGRAAYWQWQALNASQAYRLSERSMVAA
jgi:pyrroloquinoline-quinone synthase